MKNIDLDKGEIPNLKTSFGQYFITALVVIIITFSVASIMGCSIPFK